MKTAPFSMLLKSVSSHNILIITTKCGTSCIFCSHNQNPKNIDTYSSKDITLEELEIMLEFVDKNKKIIIGESATRICEGEPFAHEQITEILKRIRHKYKNTSIQITTSGVYLSEQFLDLLKELKHIELNISLNSYSEAGRTKLYKGKSHMNTIYALDTLNKYGIIFSGSIVAMPELTGWQDIEESILYLSEKGASTIRVFTPGYTKYSTNPINIDTEQKIRELVYTLREKIPTPIIFEPPHINNLKAEIAGIIKASPADGLKLHWGDVIEKINGKAAITRVDAYNKLFEASNPRIKIKRNSESFDIEIKKNKNTTAGIVFEYDIHPDTIAAINKAAVRNKGKNCKLLTSELGYEVLSACKELLEEVEIDMVKNRYFSGNIKCAGLLTISDIEEHLKALTNKPEIILLPEIMLDSAGYDIAGAHYTKLMDDYNIKAEII